MTTDCLLLESNSNAIEIGWNFVTSFCLINISLYKFKEMCHSICISIDLNIHMDTLGSFELKVESRACNPITIFDIFSGPRLKMQRKLMESWHQIERDSFNQTKFIENIIHILTFRDAQLFKINWHRMMTGSVWNVKTFCSSTYTFHRIL